MLVRLLALGWLLATAPVPATASEGWALRSQPLRGFKAATANLIFREADGGTLPIAALAVPLEPGSPSEENRTVAVFVEIDGPALLEQADGPLLESEIYAYALDAEAAVGGFLAESFSADLSALRDTLAAGGLSYAGALSLAPGEYLLRVLVRHPASGAFGLRTLELILPADGSDGGPGSGPSVLAAQPPNRWLALASPTFDALGHGQRPAPLSGRIPAARPVFVVGRNIELPLSFPAAPGAEPRLQLRKMGAATSTEPIEQPAEITDNGNLRLRLSRVDPGAYVLQVAFLGASGQESLSPPLEALVVSAETPEATLLWTDLRWQTLSSSTSPSPLQSVAPLAGKSVSEPGDADAQASETAARPRAGRRARKLATSYREALAVLAESGFAAGRKALISLETQALGRGKDPLGNLQAAQQLVASEIGKREVEGLVPLLALHLDAYGIYRGRRLHSLVTHSRQTIAALANAYTRAGGDPDRAADALVSLGADLQTAGLIALGQRMLEAASRLAPGHRGALLGLAAGSEKGGEYRQAVGYLEELEQRDPGDPEGRLRLAVNLARIGQGRRSEEILDTLATSDRGNVDGEWIHILARQQLARRHLEAGQTTAAMAILEDALRAAPGEPGLSLLLAHLYDRSNQPQKAAEIAARIDPGRTLSSPTRRYDTWPQSTTQGARQELAAAARNRRAELGSALGPEAGSSR